MRGEFEFSLLPAALNTSRVCPIPTESNTNIYIYMYSACVSGHHPRLYNSTTTNTLSSAARFYSPVSYPFFPPSALAHEKPLWVLPLPISSSHITSFSFGLVGRLDSGGGPSRPTGCRVLSSLLFHWCRTVSHAVSDESVSVGWWCGRLLLYFTLSFSPTAWASCVIVSSSLHSTRLISFFHPPSTPTFQVSFYRRLVRAAIRASFPCHPPARCIR